MSDNSNQQRISRLPTIVAFLRQSPNLAYHLSEIEKETGISSSAASGALTREHNKPTSNIVRTSGGMYMWSTNPNKPQPKIETESSVDPSALRFIGHTKSGESIYRDDETAKLYRLICEEL
jgi:hypothetical protein